MLSIWVYYAWHMGNECALASSAPWYHHCWKLCILHFLSSVLVCGKKYNSQGEFLPINAGHPVFQIMQKHSPASWKLWYTVKGASSLFLCTTFMPKSSPHPTAQQLTFHLKWLFVANSCFRAINCLKSVVTVKMAQRRTNHSINNFICISHGSSDFNFSLLDQVPHYYT